MRKPRPALIFDYDGVLADSEVLHWKSWADLLSRYDIDFSWEEYCVRGLGVSDSLLCESFWKQAGLDGPRELLQQNLDRKDRVRQWSLSEPPISQKTIAALTGLQGYSVGLVTSSERENVEPVLRACSIYERFDALVFGNDVVAHKPAPDPYLLIARQLGVDTGTAFEDSPAGVQSARAAGFEVIEVKRPDDLASLLAGFLAARRKTVNPGGQP
ncbi:MAG: HAD family phosphatase [Acidobacteria bacterium]|jgi:HAD superfamily hydrolase (TIGR01509 family)|nr:HAD family phosphatase [Acidobacteriota bacterium]